MHWTSYWAQGASSLMAHSFILPNVSCRVRELILALLQANGGRIRASELLDKCAAGSREVELFYGAVLCLEDERILVQRWPYLELVGKEA